MTAFAVMFAIGVMRGWGRIATALRRQVVLAAAVVALVEPVPALATVNEAPFTATGSVIGSTLGPGAAMAAFVQWSERR